MQRGHAGVARRGVSSRNGGRERNGRSNQRPDRTSPERPNDPKDLRDRDRIVRARSQASGLSSQSSLVPQPSIPRAIPNPRAWAVSHLSAPGSSKLGFNQNEVQFYKLWFNSSIGPPLFSGYPVFRAGCNILQHRSHPPHTHDLQLQETGVIHPRSQTIRLRG